MVRKVYTASNGARYIKLANGQCRFVSGASRQYLNRIRKMRGGGCGGDHNQRGGELITYVAHLVVTRGPRHGELGTDGAQALREGNIVENLNSAAADYDLAPLNITNARVITGRDDVIELKIQVDGDDEGFDGMPDETVADIVADIQPDAGYWVQVFKVKRGGGAWIMSGRKDTRDQPSWNLF